jgi:hypothetical protein
MSTQNGAIILRGHAVINVSTHQGAENALRERIHARPVQRINARFFGLLLAVEVLLLAAVLIWALAWLLPAPTPYAQAQSLAPLQEAVRAHVSGAVPDRLIEVTPGVSARESNLRGFRLAGTTYYYYVEGRVNFDPLSRGAVHAAGVEVLFRDDSGPSPIVIYRVR